jgi:hypothetical protein
MGTYKIKQYLQQKPKQRGETQAQGFEAVGASILAMWKLDYLYQNSQIIVMNLAKIKFQYFQAAGYTE